MKASRVEARKAVAMEEINRKVDLICQKLGIETDPAAKPVKEPKISVAPVSETDPAAKPVSKK